MQNLGKIYFIATPIGNVGDMSKRSIELLLNVNFVVCEDTRVTGVLLHQLGIKKRMISLHQHSSDKKIEQVIALLCDGSDIAYMSDSGTPGISDPGQELAAKCREQGIGVFPLPGPSAVATAISVSGMIEKEFYFAGFLAKKKGRETKLKFLATLDCPIIIYESAPRVERTLQDIKKFFDGGCEVFIAREMTKKFEEYWGGEIEEIIEGLKNHKIKGEFVLIIKKPDAKRRA